MVEYGNDRSSGQVVQKGLKPLWHKGLRPDHLFKRGGPSGRGGPEAVRGLASPVPSSEAARRATGSRRWRGALSGVRPGLDQGLVGVRIGP
jgi:hypothetical protein